MCSFESFEEINEEEINNTPYTSRMIKVDIKILEARLLENLSFTERVVYRLEVLFWMLSFETSCLIRTLNKQWPVWKRAIKSKFNK